MSVANFKPTIWSRELLYSLKKAQVGNSLVNRDYQGEITREGDTVKIQTPGSITTGAYTGADISFQSLTSATQSLAIDIARYFAFLVDDVDQAQANVNLMQSFMRESSYSLADDADELILGKYVDADSANVLGPIALSTSNIYAQITEAKKALSVANVPSIGRWIVFSPDEIALLENSTEFTAATSLGDETKRTGFVGRVAGLEVFESNNVVEVGSVRRNMFGYTGAITFADQIISTEAGRREKGFSDFVKGLHVYGCKTVRDTGIGVLQNALPS